MARNWPRISKLLFICVPVLLAGGLFIQNSTALSAETHASHDVVPEAILNYSVAPRVANAVVANPFLARPLAQTSSVGQWSGVEQWPLVAIHAAMLQNGQIIMWDRENAGTTSMRLYNPSTDTFTKIADPNGASVFCAGFAVLLDNRLLLNGGHLLTGDYYGLVDTNIYNPPAGTWAKSGAMAQARWYPSTLTLGDGRLVTMGGSITPTTYATIPEIYNPATGIWTQIGNASTNPSAIGLYPKIHLLPNGKVFWTYQGGRSRVLDVNSGVWTDASSNNAPGAFTSVQYRPGKIMESGSGQGTAVIDMNQASPAWRVTQPMAYSRYNQNLTVLPDGKVLVVGGSSNNTNSDASGILPAEMWNPDTETWTTLPAMATPRMYHSIAMLMQDGRVMVAGGGRAGSQTNYLNAEFYSPAYLFKGARPTITYAPSQAPYGANMTILTPDANSITSAVLISNPSVTHAYNMNQHYVPVTFTRNDTGRLTVQVPTNTSLVPPGSYMLFLLNSNGVPSVAPIIKIAANLPLPTPPTLTPTPSNTPIPGSSNFPTTAVLDNFNRANGSLGGNWNIQTGSIAITNNQLDVLGTSHAITFWKTLFGATQEAYVTLPAIDSSSTEIDLLLKAQSSTDWGSGVLEVWYNPSTHIARVETYTSGQGWVQRGGNINVTFQAGDRFGAKARADGYVEVYRNGTALATIDARGWTYATGGGYIGMWIINGQNNIFDDFGGGNATGAPVPTNTPTRTPAPSTPTWTPAPSNTPTSSNTPTRTPTPTPTNTPTWTPTPSNTPSNTPTRTPTPTPTNTPTPVPGTFPTTGALDNFDRANGGVGSGWAGNMGAFAVSSNQLNTVGSDAWMFRSTAYGTSQEAYFTFKTINTTAAEIDLLLKSQSGTTWGSGVIEVWYEPSTHLVRVVTYTSSSQTWVQHGANISVTFNVGDRFGARARSDGYVEVYRNETLLATVDARAWTFATSGGYIGIWVANGQNTQLDDFGGGTS